MDLLLCPSCQQILWDPVTVRCGHSFCRKCLHGPPPSRCLLCKQRLHIRGPQDLKCNTLLCDLLDKCLDRETKLDRITRDLQDLISQKEYEEAGKLASKGIGLAPEDIILRTLRSQVFVALKQYPEALRDAELICILQPQNPEGHYRKGTVLMHMKEQKEALFHLHQCLLLDSQFFAARREMGQLLEDLGCSVPSTTEDLMEETFRYLKISSMDTTRLVIPMEATYTMSQSDSACTKLHPTTAEERASFMNQPSEVPVKTSSSSNQEHPPDKEEHAVGIGDHKLEEEKLMCCHDSRSSLRDLISPSDVECSLCIRMFLDPVTTPCGHTFCKECLERSMDHRPYCPLCKQSLREYLRLGHYPVTALLQEIMSFIFPLEMTERNQVHQSEIAELSNLVQNVPIFVCTMAFPGIPCPLHVFEPRYRLMMRRCLETGTKSFGMCLYESGKSFADYGCMLEILNLDYLPDGRSLVETVGRRRFRVIKRGQIDGYHSAEVEYLADKVLEGEELQETEQLHDIVYQQLEECFSQSQGSLPSRIFMQHSQPPLKEDNIQASPDGPSWCWWLLSILPLDPTYQLLIMSLTSLKERLLHLKHILSMFLLNQS
ncbi:LON peptidase N-terminal domain and RING finger protein 1 [Xenopus laevis]|uniref:LON peptidase N-terminal domain and RING finger protein 1 n=2 Tax=Xenopus laevis TaxID=8355 RepID=A0A1L8GR64_XENLA|nr:LON peptidase N-terminal domain and RING finger protein 1 [Xenopus laevis]XP_018110392.1 LON peptidase N-terminal domain and RING finger protein 1 [Xenopus laevis]XP_018110394.1 LON peptidase N-terminal domain and RING finger protein 1 [Xenopus laevis]OCT86291.1 hypothetical protein XELAEV_18019983mg [Xenopus laevis]